MSLALVDSRARAGVDAPLVRVEVHLSGGLPVTQIVLPPVEHVDTPLLPRPYLAGSHAQAPAPHALQACLATPATATRERFKVQRAVLLKTRKKLKRRIWPCANSKGAE
ncbi:TPA: hypothetical protein ACGW00_001744 [Stenotrophomonas maltophilia]|uniref:hypothetical protein n=1 Tax=Stenotrophomonas sp. I18B00994 TaxID=2760086 RepID=UPI000DB211DC|nr:MULTISPECIES: hypothetical protein [Stenotrophomonas]PZS90353.1 hypothetical protein A7X74_18395 [Stenotrophomonas maltophilia]HBZ8061394.1 hypothetical protein [Klebsiella pneumoniae]